MHISVSALFRIIRKSFLFFLILMSLARKFSWAVCLYKLLIQMFLFDISIVMP
jgi:hypothetical protein